MFYRTLTYPKGTDFYGFHYTKRPFNQLRVFAVIAEAHALFQLEHTRLIVCSFLKVNINKLDMVNVISCPTAAILLCALAACTVATPMIDKDKRNAVPGAFLAALGDLSDRGNINVRSLAKETRSAHHTSGVSGSDPNCGNSGTDHVHTGSDTIWPLRDSAVPHEWEIMDNNGGTKSGISPLTTYFCYLVTVLSVLISLA
ncbi:hypothetical protein PoB_000969000 [Plakobranchus ocellatus]|uniref:Uncharacterized protein n=1 Tax=Plakobranchus ocellatus TaxID=259542 RepID=A0AAV3YL10_9GAST|nr:hypothetical protein PoB_000969000 [Plakobranchus ocellatus]